MVIDAVTNEVTGFYSVAGTGEVQVDDGTNGSLIVPAALLDGVALDAGLEPTVNAGLFATKRSAPATDDVSATFADFAVTSVAAPPAAPTITSAVGGDNEVVVTWGAVVDDGPVTYSVYLDEAPTPVESDLTELTYTATGLDDDTDYVVEVTASDADGNESVRSAPETATTNDNTAPLTPSNVQAVGGDQQVIVTWDAVIDDDAVTYNVFQTGLVDAVATGLTDATFTATGLRPGPSTSSRSRPLIRRATNPTHQKVRRRRPTRRLIPTRRKCPSSRARSPVTARS